jgi:hypothetical protein
MLALTKISARLGALLTLAASTCCFAPACHAAPTLVTNAYELADTHDDLALDGSATLVATRSDANTSAIRSFTGSLGSRVVSQVELSDETTGTFSFSASASRIIVLARGVTYGKGYIAGEEQQLSAGPLGGPLTDLTAGCLITPTLDEEVSGGEAHILDHNVVAADGEVVAYDSYGCVVIHDFQTGLQRVIPLEATLNPVQSRSVSDLPPEALMSLAGRLIAFRANPLGGEGAASVVVYDVDTARELYSVPLPPTVGGGSAPSFGLQSDGTLVLANPASCTASVSTSANPAPRPLGVRACSILRVRAGRVLLIAPTAGSGRALAWTSLSTPGLHMIADLGNDGALALGPADMDETNVAYALTGCYPRIYRAPLAEPGSPPALPARCPLRAAQAYATLTARSLRVRLECPLGCNGSFTAWIGIPSQRRRHKGGSFLGHEPYTGESATTGYSLPPGQAHSFTLLPTDEYEEHPSVHDVARLLHHEHEHLVLYCTTLTPPAGGLSEQQAHELGIPYRTSRVIDVPIVAGRPPR